MRLRDATALTEAGYVGEDVENILLKLLQAADFNIERAERGIIYGMKLTRLPRRARMSLSHVMFLVKGQQALLKIIEGTVASVPPQGGRKHPQQEMIQVDTKISLFIVVVPLMALKKSSNNVWVKKVIGFGQNNKAIDENSSTCKKSSQKIFKNLVLSLS